MHFSRFKRLFFAHLPTPFEPLDNLSRVLGGPKIWIKRDDCTGLAGGGNKTRKLEFLMADALEHKAQAIITQGAVQSNHVRQTVAIATKMGLPCYVLLEERVSEPTHNYEYNGNVLLSIIFGARIERRAKGSDMNEEMMKFSEKLYQEQNIQAYIIPGGGSSAIGALGYANAALEIMQQANEKDLRIDYLLHATGSSGTQAGLVTGFKALNSQIPVLGISVRAQLEAQQALVYRCARATAELLGLDDLVKESDIEVSAEYIGEGYGLPAPDTIEAINVLAKIEGILLDPVYSGKGMAGLIDLTKKGRFKRCENIVFVHTGGAQALHGYMDDFMK